MLALQEHRGPDAMGQWDGPEISLGSVRLRVQDLSPAADMPMRSRTGSYALVFNGEIYNHMQLRRRFLPGMAFRTSSDTETLLGLFEVVPQVSDVLALLDGMFAIALWEQREKRLTLARDRLGVKPLYYVLRSGSLAFASEAHALATAGPASGSLSLEGIASYLTWGSVVGAQTIYEDVRELEPGHILVHSERNTRLVRWWQPGFVPTKLSDVEASEILVSTVAESVNSQLIADRQLGVFLSSGVDSSAVASVAASSSNPSRIKAVTLTFPEDVSLNEEVAARAIANRLGLAHTCVPVASTDVHDLLNQFFCASDQPTFDGFNSYLVARAAAEAGVTVALSGLGGDELFGGYGMEGFAQRNRRRAGWLSILAMPARRQLGKWSSHWRPGSGAARLLPARTGEQIYLATRGIFDQAFVRRLLPGIEVALPVWPAEADFRDSITLLEWRTYLASQLLRDTDVASMRHSLEVRVPLLSNALLDFTLSLPSDQRFRIGKRSLALLAGHSIAPVKQGFDLPYERWMRTTYAPALREGLLSQDLPLSDVLDQGHRRRLYQAFLAGRVHWMRPWLVASLRLWAHVNDMTTVGSSTELKRRSGSLAQSTPRGDRK